MGADERLFSAIEPIDGYEFIDIEWQYFSKIKTLKDYAVQIVKQIDTTRSFSLLGVSLGGMVCSELADIIHPEKVVIISSAKISKELPPQLTRLKFIGVTRLLNTQRIEYLVGNSSRFFGAMNSNQKKMFDQMVGDVNLDFVVWGIKAIINWGKKTASAKIIHIHGTKDVVLPISNIIPTIIIEKGDHLMVWNKSEEINRQLKEIFNPLGVIK